VEAPPSIAPAPAFELLDAYIMDAAVLPGVAIIGTDAIAVPPQPEPAPPPAPVRVTGHVRPPEKVRHVAPVYPVNARTARMQGTVIIEATIGVDGRVQDARVLRSILLLDEAALAAVRQWTFTPTTLNGVPVPVIMTVTVHFTLQ
jgi:protein TonB